MSKYDYIRANIENASEGKYWPGNADKLLALASAQAAYEQLLLLERMRSVLYDIEHHLSSEKAKKRAAAAANSPLLQELDSLGAPSWIIEALQGLMNEESESKSALALLTLDELRVEVRQSNNYALHSRWYDYHVESGLQRGLRVLLFDEPDPHGFLRLEDHRKHPLWRLINGLSLSTRTQHALNRHMSPERLLWWMTPDEFLVELQQENGGKLAHLREFGKVGLAQVRAALNGAMVSS